MADAAIRTPAPPRGFNYIPVRTPASDNFFMPAEWAPHSRCWMAWPRLVELWGAGMQETRTAYSAVAQAVAGFEEVVMLAHPDDLAQAAEMCGNSVKVVPSRVEDAWTRDSGPTFVVNDRGEVAGIDWMFNGWGHFYAPKTNDESMALDILAREDIRRYVAPFILEGGSIHVDGEGTLITTEQCLLDPARNIGLTKRDFEELFAAYLGIRQVIWLGEGLDGDDTNGHVDIVSCFVRPGVVLIQSCDDPKDPNYKVFQDNMHRLELSCDAAGRPVEIITVPQPEYVEHEGKRLDLSYINFYMANGGVVMSSFGDANDAVAYELFRRLYPDRKLVVVDSLPIFKGGGGIHCITQQQPAGVGKIPF
ncbi:MAG: agmatine deiminase family protein [Desulfovibrio sp.]|uniref:agmatine deiminase family protein n=1 Tax=Desulfovibrio sp. 7SRBS1 TaxID=3378064 RepID=UPI003B41449F